MAERENRRGPRREREEAPEFADRLVAINRVSKTVKGGNSIERSEKKSRSGWLPEAPS